MVLVENPLKWTAPATSNKLPGVLVPIPTLPSWKPHKSGDSDCAGADKETAVDGQSLGEAGSGGADAEIAGQAAIEICVSPVFY